MAPKTQVRTDDVLNNLDNYAGLPIMGYTVMWRAAGVDIDHATLVNLLTAQDFAQFAPDLPTAKRALRRAIVAWLKDRAKNVAAHATIDALDDDDPSGKGTVKRALIRPINTAKSSLMSFTVVREDIDLTAFGLEHDTALRFILDKETGALCCTTLEGAPEDVRTQHDPVGAIIEGELTPLWDHYRNQHTTADVLRTVRDIVLSAMSFSLRREGGVYFVPESKRGTVIGLRDFFASLTDACPDSTAFALTLPQIDFGGARAQLSVAAHAAMEDEIARMKTYLQDAFVNAKPGTVRPASITKQIEQFKQVRGKVDAYRELLGMREDKIAAELEELTALARSVIVKAADAVEAEDAQEGDDAEPPTT